MRHGVFSAFKRSHGPIRSVNIRSKINRYRLSVAGTAVLAGGYRTTRTDMLDTLESIVSEAEATWWRAEAARSVASQAEAGARIQDIANRYVPVYTVDLLKLAQRDVDLATIEPTLEAVLQRRMTATGLIARNVFDAVTDHLWRLYYARVVREGRRDAA